jgi:hypothetical protein
MRVMLYLTSVKLSGRNHVVVYVGDRRVGTLDLSDAELSTLLARYQPDVIAESFAEVLDVLSHS